MLSAVLRTHPTNDNTPVPASRIAQEAGKAAFEAEVRRLHFQPPHPKLRAGDDLYSGKLAVVNMRVQLREAFPEARISVRVASHGSIVVSWTAGPTVAQVRAITDPYQSGEFSGLDDTYETARSPWNVTFGGVRYLEVRRTASSAMIENAIDAVFAEHAAALAGVDRPLPDDYFCGRLLFTPVDLGDRSEDLGTLVRNKAALL